MDGFTKSQEFSEPAATVSPSAEDLLFLKGTYLIPQFFFCLKIVLAQLGEAVKFSVPIT